MCDSALLAAHLFDFGPARLGEFIAGVAARDPAARLNLLVTDGQRMLATRWKDTLSVLRAGDGVVLASEPFDDDTRWTDVPDHHLVDVTGGTVTLTSLES